MSFLTVSAAPHGITSTGYTVNVTEWLDGAEVGGKERPRRCGADVDRCRRCDGSGKIKLAAIVPGFAIKFNPYREFIDA
jgi:hypothetical protein